MSNIDHGNTIAFVITLEDGNRGEQVIADVRSAVVVDDHWQHHGLDRRVVQALSLAAQQAGLRWLYGDVRASNVQMLSLMRRCCFSCTPGVATALHVLRWS